MRSMPIQSNTELQIYRERNVRNVVLPEYTEYIEVFNDQFICYQPLHL